MNLTLRTLLITTALIAVSSCSKQGSKMVYVLEEPQQVTLIASASPEKLGRGEQVTLHAERRSVGKWKQIPMDQVTQGQCWVYQIPDAVEPEVADSVEWDVHPDGSVLFRPEYRLDHKRIITTDRMGRITLTPRTTVKCETDRIVEGQPIQIQVI
jgi:hypothetical protein